MLTNSLRPNRRRSFRIPFTVLSLVFAVLVLTFPLAPSLAQNTSKTQDLTVRVEQESKEQILVDLPAGSAFDSSLSKIPAIVTFNQTTRKLKGMSKGAENYKIVYKEGEKVHTQEGKVMVQGVKTWTIKRLSDAKPYTSDQPIILSKGSTWSVEARATIENGDDNVSDVTLESKSPTIFKVESKSPAKLEAKEAGEGILAVKLGSETKEFKVQVLEPIDKANSDAILDKPKPKIELAEGATSYTTPPIKLKTTGGKEVSLTDPGRDFKIVIADTAKAELVEIEGYKIRARLVDSKKYPGDTVSVSADLVTNQGIKADGTSDTIKFPVDIVVVVQGAIVSFEGPPTKVLLEDDSVTLKAYIRARDGSPLTNMKVKNFVYTRPCDEKFVELVQDVENSSVTVIRRLLETTDEKFKNCDKEPSTVAIKANAQKVDGTGPEYPGIAVVRLRRIKGFHPLSVKINVMDKQTAEDLYGRVASNEYYILNVRMFNDLKDDETGKFLGDAIIVYSASIELAVNLEKQYDNNSKSAKKKQPTRGSNPDSKSSYIDDGRWYEVDAISDLASIRDPDITVGPPLDKDKLRKHEEDNVCKGTITYRPLTFEMVVNTVDRRDKRSVRSRVFDSLELVGLAASFSSAIRFPRPGRDLPIMTDSFTNLLVPGLEKVFPSFKEQNRQNIVSQVMKPLEEVPFGSDLTRVLFVPKRSIRGIVPDHKTRISQICPFFFKVQVAVVDKKGQATVQQGTRN